MIPQPLTRGHSLRIALALSFAVAVSGQSPPAWSYLPVPGGVAAAFITAQGKVVTYPEATQVHAYSAFTHRWVTQATGVQATVRVAPDLALATDGTTYHAFSAYTGAWSSLTLSANATVVNPTEQFRDSIWLVRDGMDLWAFTGFRGAWSRLTISANASMQVEGYVALVNDGTTMHAMSAFRGAWVTTTAAGTPTSSRARGTAAVVVSNAGVQGFSAHANAWASAPSPGLNAEHSAHHDVQIISASSNYLAFSGLLGTFAPITLPAARWLRIDETLCYATDDGVNFWAYSAVRGVWTTLPSGVCTPYLASNALLLVQGDRVHAFSAMTGTVDTAMGQPAITQIGRGVAYALGFDNSIRFYSVSLGLWFLAPAGTSPQISDVAGLVRTTGGFAAFSSRTGRFTTLALPGGGTTTIGRGNSVQAVNDATTMHLFDARRERWLSVPSQSAGAWIVGATLFTIDSPQVYGYGSLSGKLTAITPAALPPVGTLRMSSESVAFPVSNGIYCHSSVPDLLTLWQFPDLPRVYTTASPMELQVHAGDGVALTFLGLRVLPVPMTITGLGDLDLDPSALLSPSGLPMTVAQNRGVLSFPVPAVPGLQGIEVSFQAVVLPTAGAPYLTQSTSVTIY